MANKIPKVGDTVIFKPMIVARVFDDGSFYASLDGKTGESHIAAEPEHVARIEPAPLKVGDVMKRGEDTVRLLHEHKGDWFVEWVQPEGRVFRTTVLIDAVLKNGSWERV